RGAGAIAQRQEVAGRRHVRLIHRLIRLHLTENANVRIVRQQGVDRLQNALVGGMGVFRFADVGALASQPQNDVSAVERVGDVNGALRALDGVLAFGGTVRGVTT